MSQYVFAATDALVAASTKLGGIGAAIGAANAAAESTTALAAAAAASDEISAAIARTSAMPSGLPPVTGCELHLVKPLKFDPHEPKLLRAELDCHDLATVTVHASREAFHR